MNVALLVMITLVAAMGAPVPTVDHLSAKTSMINKHVAARHGVTDASDADVAADASTETSNDAPPINEDLLVAGDASAASSSSSVNTDVRQVPLGGSKAPEAAPSKQPAAKPAVQTKASGTSLSDEVVRAEFAALLKSDVVFSAFLDDMAAEEARHAAYQGELVDVKCPTSGGQCDLVFQQAGSAL